MTDDLVQRLRRTYRKEFAVTGSMFADNSNRLCPFPILATEVLFNPDGREAANLIEALTAENERLNKSAECLAESRRLAVKDVAELEAEIERLRRPHTDALKIARELRQAIREAGVKRTTPRLYAAVIAFDVALAALEQSK